MRKQVFYLVSGRPLTIALLISAVTLAGCAGGLAALGDSETEKAIESAAADTSFPSAAEAGVVTTTK
jgi:hypothetical protein